MTSEELKRSWKKTTGFLLDARSNISESADGIYSDEILQFHEFVDHNELELALDMLDEIFERSNSESWHMLELMAMAASNMGLDERVKDYDERLSKARGWIYKTKLKSEPNKADAPDRNNLQGLS